MARRTCFDARKSTGSRMDSWPRRWLFSELLRRPAAWSFVALLTGLAYY